MSSEAISTIFTIEGLLILATILVGTNNPELIVNAGFYILLPLVGIVTVISFFSLFSKNTFSYHKKLLFFFAFNLVILLALIAFIYWDLGN